ncbi:MAG TPA: glycosyltransferase [Bacteroidales bacterium]|nr:glycosyltransferase [Bacteroidales bacterium]
MPKLLQISIEVNSGSVGRIAELIGQKAIEAQWESYITYARNNLPSKSHVIKIGKLFDVYVHGVMTRLTDRHGFYSTAPTRKLISQINEIKPDIIHLHHLHGYFINIKVLFDFLASSGIPVIWTFHDCWSFTGHCAHFEYVNCKKWITGCYNCPQKREYPASLIFDRSKENYLEKRKLFLSVKQMVIVPVSYWLGDLVKKSFLNQYNIHVIQNGIDTELFKPASDLRNIREKYAFKDKFIILGVAGIWSKLKGLDDFIRLSKELDPNYLIILVGLTNQQIRNLPSNIIGIEKTENILELASLYSVADVFVNPTYEDSFPTTNLEALACGTPVITYKTGGSAESVSVETGFVVNKGDIMGIIQCVKMIEKAGKIFYTEHCRNRALKLYNKDDNYSKYIHLYKKILRY